MAIDKIGHINNYNDIHKVNKSKNIKKSQAADSVNISNEAYNLADNKKIMDIVKNAPDIRLDKVSQAKANIDNPAYLEKAIQSIADKIFTPDNG